MFFGLDEEYEETEKLKWLDRRKRLATRKYGELKSEYVNSVNDIPITHISQVLLACLYNFIANSILIFIFSRMYYNPVEILMNGIVPLVFNL